MAGRDIRVAATALTSPVDGGLITLYVVAILIGANAKSLRLWLIILVIVGTAALLGWTRAYRRTRVVKDTPTSQVVSAPQGYVELIGIAERPGYIPLLTKWGDEPCVWFRYLVEKKSGDKYKHVEGGVSPDTFILRDRSGTCLVDPADATVIPKHKRQWKDGDYRYTEHWLAPRDPIYALGLFQTLTPGTDPAEFRAQTSAVLASWKSDRPTLLQRFDINGDGELDLKEWEAAREAARAEVSRNNAPRDRKAGTHLMRHPGDKRPFLLSARSPQSLERYLNRWSLFHLVVAIGAMAGSLFVATHLAIR